MNDINQQLTQATRCVLLGGSGRSPAPRESIGIAPVQFGWERPYLTYFGHHAEAEPLPHGVNMEDLEWKPGQGPSSLLTDESSVADCVKCSGERAVYRLWQSSEGGCTSEHWSIRCPDCGFMDDDATPSREAA
jgi:hypothetical protein